MDHPYQINLSKVVLAPKRSRNIPLIKTQQMHTGLCYVFFQFLKENSSRFSFCMHKISKNNRWCTYMICLETVWVKYQDFLGVIKEDSM